ncbi:MAG: hypothetical protein HY586_05065, partial [Candidatus Omnitrophica bacterium]|nr:hypothetical protein [Candidatus Omnitrophota bacterium]
PKVKPLSAHAGILGRIMSVNEYELETPLPDTEKGYAPEERRAALEANLLMRLRVLDYFRVHGITPETVQAQNALTYQHAWDETVRKTKAAWLEQGKIKPGEELPETEMKKLEGEFPQNFYEGEVASLATTLMNGQKERKLIQQPTLLTPTPASHIIASAVEQEMERQIQEFIRVRDIVAAEYGQIKLEGSSRSYENEWMLQQAIVRASLKKQYEQLGLSPEVIHRLIEEHLAKYKPSFERMYRNAVVTAITYGILHDAHRGNLKKNIVDSSELVNQEIKDWIHLVMRAYERQPGVDSTEDPSVFIRFNEQDGAYLQALYGDPRPGSKTPGALRARMAQVSAMLEERGLELPPGVLKNYAEEFVKAFPEQYRLGVVQGHVSRLMQDGANIGDVEGIVWILRYRSIINRIFEEEMRPLNGGELAIKTKEFLAPVMEKREELLSLEGLRLKDHPDSEPSEEEKGLLAAIEKLENNLLDNEHGPGKIRRVAKNYALAKKMPLRIVDKALLDSGYKHEALHDSVSIAQEILNKGGERTEIHSIFDGIAQISSRVESDFHALTLARPSIESLSEIKDSYLRGLHKIDNDTAGKEEKAGRNMTPEERSRLLARLLATNQRLKTAATPVFVANLAPGLLALKESKLVLNISDGEETEIWERILTGLKRAGIEVGYQDGQVPAWRVLEGLAKLTLLVLPEGIFGSGEEERARKAGSLDSLIQAIASLDKMSTGSLDEEIQARLGRVDLIETHRVALSRAIENERVPAAARVALRNVLKRLEEEKYLLSLLDQRRELTDEMANFYAQYFIPGVLPQEQVKRGKAKREKKALGIPPAVPRGEEYEISFKEFEEGQEEQFYFQTVYGALHIKKRVKESAGGGGGAEVVYEMERMVPGEIGYWMEQTRKNSSLRAKARKELQAQGIESVPEDAQQRWVRDKLAFYMRMASKMRIEDQNLAKKLRQDLYQTHQQNLETPDRSGLVRFLIPLTDNEIQGLIRRYDEDYKGDEEKIDEVIENFFRDAYHHERLFIEQLGYPGDARQILAQIAITGPEGARKDAPKELQEFLDWIEVEGVPFGGYYRATHQIDPVLRSPSAIAFYRGFLSRKLSVEFNTLGGATPWRMALYERELSRYGEQVEEAERSSGKPEDEQLGRSDGIVLSEQAEMIEEMASLRITLEDRVSRLLFNRYGTVDYGLLERFLDQVEAKALRHRVDLGRVKEIHRQNAERYNSLEKALAESREEAKLKQDIRKLEFIPLFNSSESAVRNELVARLEQEIDGADGLQAVLAEVEKLDDPHLRGSVLERINLNPDDEEGAQRRRSLIEGLMIQEGQSAKDAILNALVRPLLVESLYRMHVLPNRRTASDPNPVLTDRDHEMIYYLGTRMHNDGWNADMVREYLIDRERVKEILLKLRKIPKLQGDKADMEAENALRLFSEQGIAGRVLDFDRAQDRVDEFVIQFRKDGFRFTDLEGLVDLADFIIKAVEGENRTQGELGYVDFKDFSGGSEKRGFKNALLYDLSLYLKAHAAHPSEVAHYGLVETVQIPLVTEVLREMDLPHLGGLKIDENGNRIQVSPSQASVEERARFILRHIQTRNEEMGALNVDWMNFTRLARKALALKEAVEIHFEQDPSKILDMELLLVYLDEVNAQE